MLVLANKVEAFFIILGIILFLLLATQGFVGFIVNRVIHDMAFLLGRIFGSS